MKIAMMTNNYKPYIGGVPISIERLTVALREQGHRVVVFAPKYKFLGDEQAQEEDVVRYSTLSQHFYSDTVLPNPLDPVLEETFARENFDVIHVHHPVLIGKVAAYLSRKYGIPLVYTYHTQYEQYLDYAGPIHWLSQGAEKDNLLGRLRCRGSRAIKQEIAPWYLSGFMRRCHTVIAPTEGMKRVFRMQYGYPYNCRADVSVLPTGLTQESYRAEPKAVMGIRQRYCEGEMPLMVTVSRLGHEKNVPFLLRCMARLKQFLPDFRLMVIGDGPQREEYMDLCEQLDIRQQICFLGSLPNREIAAHMAAADCFVFASKTETQGIVILEAMAAKTPVVAVRASGVEDLVEDGVNGYLCPEEEENYTEQLLRVLQSEPLRDSLRVGAFQTALMYREDSVAEKAVRIYTDTCRQYAASHTGTQISAFRDLRERLRLLG
ncbi:MAG: glycosyltransferase [bacterium]|nr:glycosyltransferase [bacterium]MCM1375691.1 glycosyltransferase [Muribaculum sp.]